MSAPARVTLATVLERIEAAPLPEAEDLLSMSLDELEARLRELGVDVEGDVDDLLGLAQAPAGTGPQARSSLEALDAADLEVMGRTEVESRLAEAGVDAEAFLARAEAMIRAARSGTPARSAGRDAGPGGPSRQGGDVRSGEPAPWRGTRPARRVPRTLAAGVVAVTVAGIGFLLVREHPLPLQVPPVASPEASPRAPEPARAAQAAPPFAAGQDTASAPRAAAASGTTSVAPAAAAPDTASAPPVVAAPGVAQAPEPAVAPAAEPPPVAAAAPAAESAAPVAAAPAAPEADTAAQRQRADLPAIRLAAPALREVPATVPAAAGALAPGPGMSPVPDVDRAFAAGATLEAMLAGSAPAADREALFRLLGPLPAGSAGRLRIWLEDGRVREALLALHGGEPVRVLRDAGGRLYRAGAPAGGDGPPPGERR